MKYVLETIKANKIKSIIIAFTISIFWFIPWIFTLYTGILIYFPYNKNGKDRFIRITGPMVGIFSKSWVSEHEIPSYCKTALVAAEDAEFYNHPGIDIESIKNSIKQNRKSNKIVSGGSTITMQLVKNAFLSRNKTYIRKIREIIGAIILDYSVSKKKQIVWYLNIVEFGPEIYGLQNAAWHYYHKNSKQLNAHECSSLIALLPKPVPWGTKLKNGYQTYEFSKRYYRIISEVQPWTNKHTSGNHLDKYKKLDVPVISDIPELE